MLFLFHVVALVYGLLAVLAGKLRTSGPVWDAGSSKLYESVEMFFPESVFSPWKKGVPELTPDLTRTYLIGGGLVAYSLNYLFKRHRG